MKITTVKGLPISSPDFLAKEKIDNDQYNVILKKNKKFDYLSWRQLNDLIVYPKKNLVSLPKSNKSFRIGQIKKNY
ncbi:hypothetical protein C122C_0065 [Leuconostoc gelidum subsp. gasicomitatum]|uniref:Uncharacterized protein n=1 Tax=Leuconostoc gasicomitatum TaxID=115778 RepID=A0ABM9V5H9_9LACO|nr:hypothetical protein [Leuconostoc gasicomitatum]CUW14481.1 hypothetical protein C122C_0065 [Leuconostoc gasicomitatum]